jgi:hypothetical protein
MTVEVVEHAADVRHLRWSPVPQAHLASIADARQNCQVMPKRYFLDESGARTTRMQGLPGKGHIAIAKEVLPQHGITPTDDKDCYVQMFKLKYVRVVVHDDGSVEAEHCAALTAAQKRFFEGMERQGRKVNYKKTNI